MFHAASTMKVPVMIELFRQAKTGDDVFHKRIGQRRFSVLSAQHADLADRQTRKTVVLTQDTHAASDRR